MTSMGSASRAIVSVALQQIALGALLSLMLAAWLHVPDANAFEVMASVVLAMSIVAVAGAGESIIALRLTGGRPTAGRLARGTGAVFTVALLWLLMSAGIDQFAMKDGLRAGYLNSRAPAPLRNFLTYEHLTLWLGWMEEGLRWIAVGLFAAPAFVLITCRAPAQKLSAIFRSRRYWIAVVLFAVVAAVITGRVLFWTPGHGLPVEMLSFVLRAASVLVLNAVAIALVLQAMARAVRSPQWAGRGEPETSQSRTAENP